MLEKNTFLTNIINETLIYQEAKKEKIDQQEEIKKIINLYIKQIIINAYIEKNIEKEINFNISEQEISDYYEANKDEFSKDDPDIAKEKIKYQIKMKKYEEDLAKLIEKLRKEYKIERNIKTLKISMPEKPEHK